MTIVFAANGYAGFDLETSSYWDWDTTAGHFDADYVSGAIWIKQYVGAVSRPFDTALSEGWAHFESYILGSSSVDQEIFMLKDGTDPVLRIKCSNGYIDSLQAWTGSAWTSLGHCATMAVDGGLMTFDVHFKLDNSTGIFDVYLNGVLFATYHGDTIRSTSTTIDRLRVSSPCVVNNSSSYCASFSQIFAADSDTRGLKLRENAISAAGTTNTFDTGTYADVDDVGLSNDADFVSSGTADQIITVTADDLAAGEVPLAVVVNARCVTSGGPANINAAVRSGGTDYFSGDLAAPGSYGAAGYCWNVDPNTASAWAEAAVNAAEPGVRSRA